MISDPFAPEADACLTNADVQHFAGAIRQLRREISNRDWIIWQLAKASGGSVRIPDMVRISAVSPEFHTWYDIVNYETVIEAR